MSKRQEVVEVFVDMVLEERVDSDEDFDDYWFEAFGELPDDEDRELLTAELVNRGIVSVEDLKEAIESDHWSDEARAREIAEKLRTAGVRAELDWDSGGEYSGDEEDDGRGRLWKTYHFTLTVGGEEVATWEQTAIAELLDGLHSDYSVSSLDEWSGDQPIPPPVQGALDGFEIAHPEFATEENASEGDIEIEHPWLPDQYPDGDVGIYWELEQDPDINGVVAYGSARDAIEGMEFAAAFDADGRHVYGQFRFVRRVTADELAEYQEDADIFARQGALFDMAPPEPPGDVVDDDGARWFFIEEEELSEWE